MADSIITNLTAYTTPIATDVLPIVDVTANVTKKITIANLSASVAPTSVAILQCNVAANVSGTTVIAHGLGKTPNILTVNATGGLASNEIGYGSGAYNGTVQSATAFSLIPSGGNVHNVTQTTGAFYYYSPTYSNTLVGVVSWDATNITITWTSGIGNSFSVYFQITVR